MADPIDMGAADAQDRKTRRHHRAIPANAGPAPPGRAEVGIHPQGTKKDIIRTKIISVSVSIRYRACRVGTKMVQTCRTVSFAPASALT
ncbi:hypothetical protein [Oceaniradius stylonematis]|uniref:hypothetical protein n=1 Tax=Oceaniradius stylonematis TaxID=2184161 RepID=UPI0018C8A019|nr:hypothetical protein [Oceaniradius stylonematis]